MTPNPKLAWPIAWEAVVEIARSEGCKLKAYRCPAGVLTIAWGRTKGVKAGDTCTQEQADQWLMEDLSEDEQPMPQAIEPESSLKNSPIATAGAASILAGLTAGVGAMTEQGQQIALTLGVDPMVGFAIVVVWTGAVSLYQRIKQRKEGWA